MNIITRIYKGSFIMQKGAYDIFIIGGGINGCGLARDASGRGYKVALAEKNDLASATSSASSKLIHGGLRYLEQHAFWMVREALLEREILLYNAPHLVKPGRFLLPYDAQKRPFWLLRLGLFLYDHLACQKNFLSTRSINFKKQYRDVLKPHYERGFEYSDAFVDDARLVIANARHAKKLGADIFVRWRVVQAKKQENLWHITLKNEQGEQKEIFASYLINAAGPYIAEVIHDVLEEKQKAPVRLVKGSHIVVPSLYSHDKAYILQNKDNRIVFVIPYKEDFTLIGTTDIDYQGNPLDAKISQEEITYLCDCVNEYFEKKVEEDQIIWSYSGVRPLYDDGTEKAQETTRDYVLKEIKTRKHPPLLNIYGGKITTYRKLSEDALKLVEHSLHQMSQKWTAKIPLPGGDFNYKNIVRLEKRLKAMRPEFSDKTIKRLISAYGTESLEIFTKTKDKGQHFGHDFYEIELLWMIEQEWAYNLDDVLWRRSKLGLYFSEEEKKTLKDFMEVLHKKTSDN